MTLQDAIKTGKRFKRNGWEFWLRSFNGDVVLYRKEYQTRDDIIRLNIESIFAEDWETKEGEDE